MKSYNRATLIGHVGNDVILRHTQKGKPVVNLRLATSTRRKDGPEETTWHRVVLWDRLAEISDRYLSRGQPVYVEGPIQNRQWIDKDGTTHWQTEVTARELILLSPPPSANERPTLSTTYTNPAPAADGEELSEVVADIPF